MGQVEHIFFLRKGAGKPINDCGVSDLLSFPNIKEKNADGTNLRTPYGIAVNPENGDVYLTDAYQYTTNGDVYCFGSVLRAVFRKADGATDT